MAAEWVTFGTDGAVLILWLCWTVSHHDIRVSKGWLGIRAYPVSPHVPRPARRMNRYVRR